MSKICKRICRCLPGRDSTSHSNFISVVLIQAVKEAEAQARTKKSKFRAAQAKEEAAAKKAEARKVC
jgi:hypothetical protein